MRSMQWQLGILGTILAFAYRHRETKKNLCRGGRSQDFPNTDQLISCLLVMYSATWILVSPTESIVEIPFNIVEVLKGSSERIVKQEIARQGLRALIQYIVNYFLGQLTIHFYCKRRLSQKERNVQWLGKNLEEGCSCEIKGTVLAFI